MKKRNTACLRVTRIHAITHYALRRIHMTLMRIMRDDAPIRIMRARIYTRYTYAHYVRRIALHACDHIMRAMRSGIMRAHYVSGARNISKHHLHPLLK